MSNSKSGHPLVHIRSASGPVQLSLLDQDRRPVVQGYGEIRKKVPAGLYLLDIDSGSSHDRRIISVDPKQGYSETDLHYPILSAAPFPGTGSDPETDAALADAAQNASCNPHLHRGSGSRIVLFVRSTTNALSTEIDLEGISLLDEDGDDLADSSSFIVAAENGWATLSLDVSPGGYILRQSRTRRRDGTSEVIDQSLWAEEGWTTLFFVPLRRTDGVPLPEYGSVHMARLERGFQPFDPGSRTGHLSLEMVLSGLRKGVTLVPKSLLEMMLDGETQNPMLGLVGGLALLHKRDRSWKRFDRVRRHLQRLIPEHPDLHALHVIGKQLRRVDSNSRIPPIAWPPMLHDCYQGVIERNLVEGDLIPAGSLADHAAARRSSQGPWTRWRAIPEDDIDAGGEILERRVNDLVRKLRTNLSPQPPAATTRSAVRSRSIDFDEDRDEIFSFSLKDDTSAEASEAADPENTTSPETLHVASFLESMTEQGSASRKASGSGIKIDVSQISRATDLPLPAVHRALRALRGYGLDFDEE